jgi:hypothetical protein
MLSIDDATRLAPIAFAFSFGDEEFIVVPVADTEPRPMWNSRVLCPIAFARGANSSDVSLDLLADMGAGALLSGACQQCEGLWMFAHDTAVHIAGDRLAQFQHERYPDLNAAFEYFVRRGPGTDA